jgi:hypothetical protein
MGIGESAPRLPTQIRIVQSRLREVDWRAEEHQKLKAT